MNRPAKAEGADGVRSPAQPGASTLPALTARPYPGLKHILGKVSWWQQQGSRLQPIRAAGLRVLRTVRRLVHRLPFVTIIAGHLRSSLANLIFERRLGVATTSPVSLRELDLEAEDRVHYAPSGWRVLGLVLPRHEVAENDVFLDYGSGKGRIVLLAAMYRFRRVIGVEISPVLHEIAVRNIEHRRMHLTCKDVVLINMAAESFDVPDDVTVVYFFNPFGGEVFAQVARSLFASFDCNPRRLRIVYHQADEEDFLLQTGRVRLVRSVRSLDGRPHTRLFEVLPRSEPAAEPGKAAPSLS